MRSMASSPRCVKAPDCRSIASTRVVLPWSTWATMATLRKSTSASLAVWSVDRENERSLVRVLPGLDCNEVQNVVPHAVPLPKLVACSRTAQVKKALDRPDTKPADTKPADTKDEAA